MLGSWKICVQNRCRFKILFGPKNAWSKKMLSPKNIGENFFQIIWIHQKLRIKRVLCCKWNGSNKIKGHKNVWPADSVQISPVSHLNVAFKFQDSDAFHCHSKCQLAKLQDLKQSWNLQNGPEYERNSSKNSNYCLIIPYPTLAHHTTYPTALTACNHTQAIARFPY